LIWPHLEGAIAALLRKNQLGTTLRFLNSLVGKLQEGILPSQNPLALAKGGALCVCVRSDCGHMGLKTLFQVGPEMGPEVGLEMGPGQGQRHVPNDSKTQGGRVGPRKKQKQISQVRLASFKRYETFSESVLEFSQKLFSLHKFEENNSFQGTKKFMMTAAFFLSTRRYLPPPKSL